MKREINQLIENCTQLFEESHYVKERIVNYLLLWNRGIVRYMKDKNITVYTSELRQNFIEECFPENDLRPTAKEMIRSI